MKKTWMAVTWMALMVQAANGQKSQDAPEFEVASVKPAPPGSEPPIKLPPAVAAQLGFAGGPGTKDPGRIDYSKVTLQMLLARAYQLKPDQISGPGWLETERYIVAAKLPPGTDADGLRLMLQKLLTERFQISMHREHKELPVYRLKVAKNGPRLKPAEEQPVYQNDEAWAEARRKQREESMARSRADMESGKSTNRLNLSSATAEGFAEALSGNLDRPVKDMTQLEGKYSFHLQWTPESARRAGGDDLSGPSIFEAIQEQLGLKLETGKALIELLVIDKAEKVPTSN